VFCHWFAASARKIRDAAHIRDILALLRFVENPRDGVARDSARCSSSREWDRYQRGEYSTT
jgi:hypothetical protein